MIRILTLALWIAVGGLSATAASAFDDPQSEQDRARDEVKSGRMIPYGEIKARAERMFGGRVVGQRMRQFARDRWVYELRILKQGGEVLSVTVDARTGDVIGQRGGRRR